MRRRRHIAQSRFNMAEPAVEFGADDVGGADCFSQGANFFTKIEIGLFVRRGQGGIVQRLRFERYRPGYGAERPVFVLVNGQVVSAGQGQVTGFGAAKKLIGRGRAAAGDRGRGVVTKIPDYTL